MIKIITILFFFFFLLCFVHGDAYYVNEELAREGYVSISKDTNIYDIAFLDGKNDRKPEFYACIGSSHFPSNRALEYCISSHLVSLTDKLQFPIKKVLVKSNWNSQYNSVIDFSIRYRSSFKILLSKEGFATDVEAIGHSLMSISEEKIVGAIKETEWRPAIKKFLPVRSEFTIELIYFNKVCHDEAWFERRELIVEEFETYRKELADIYRKNGAMWDLEILEPMMSVENEIELNTFFDKVEGFLNVYLDSLGMEYSMMRNELFRYDCNKSYEVVDQWDGDCQAYIDEKLKEVLSEKK